MRQQHFGEDELAVGRLSRIRLDLRDATFEGDRRASHPLHLHETGRFAGDTTVLELAEAMGQSGGRRVHRLGLLSADELNDQLTGIVRIASGVLGQPILEANVD